MSNITQLLNEIESLELKIDIAEFNQRPVKALKAKLASLTRKLDALLDDDDQDD